MADLEYTEEEIAELRGAMGRLRKAREGRKVPFYWVQYDYNGQPRLVVGMPKKARVKSKDALPIRRKAKNKAFICEGLAWRDDKKGFVLSVMRGGFRANQIRKDIRRIGKVVGVQLGQVTVEQMETHESEEAGKDLVRENDAMAAEADTLRADSANIEAELEALGVDLSQLEAVGPDSPAFDKVRALVENRQKVVDLMAETWVLTDRDRAEFISAAGVEAHNDKLTFDEWRKSGLNIEDAADRYDDPVQLEWIHELVRRAAVYDDLTVLLKGSGDEEVSGEPASGASEEAQASSQAAQARAAFAAVASQALSEIAARHTACAETWTASQAEFDAVKAKVDAAVAEGWAPQTHAAPIQKLQLQVGSLFPVLLATGNKLATELSVAMRRATGAHRALSGELAYCGRRVGYWTGDKDPEGARAAQIGAFRAETATDREPFSPASATAAIQATLAGLQKDVAALQVKCDALVKQAEKLSWDEALRQKEAGLVSSLEDAQKARDAFNATRPADKKRWTEALQDKSAKLRNAEYSRGKVERELAALRQKLEKKRSDGVGIFERKKSFDEKVDALAQALAEKEQELTQITAQIDSLEGIEDQLEDAPEALLATTNEGIAAKAEERKRLDEKCALLRQREILQERFAAAEEALGDRFNKKKKQKTHAALREELAQLDQKLSQVDEGLPEASKGASDPAAVAARIAAVEGEKQALIAERADMARQDDSRLGAKEREIKDKDAELRLLAQKRTLLSQRDKLQKELDAKGWLSGGKDKLRAQIAQLDKQLGDFDKSLPPALIKYRGVRDLAVLSYELKNVEAEEEALLEQRALLLEDPEDRVDALDEAFETKDRKRRDLLTEQNRLKEKLAAAEKSRDSIWPSFRDFEQEIGELRQQIDAKGSEMEAIDAATAALMDEKARAREALLELGYERLKHEEAVMDAEEALARLRAERAHSSTAVAQTAYEEELGEELQAKEDEYHDAFAAQKEAEEALKAASKEHTEARLAAAELEHELRSLSGIDTDDIVERAEWRLRKAEAELAEIEAHQARLEDPQAQAALQAGWQEDGINLNDLFPTALLKAHNDVLVGDIRKKMKALRRLPGAPEIVPTEAQAADIARIQEVLLAARKRAAGEGVGAAQVGITDAKTQAKAVTLSRKHSEAEVLIPKLRMQEEGAEKALADSEAAQALIERDLKEMEDALAAASGEEKDALEQEVALLRKRVKGRIDSTKEARKRLADLGKKIKSEEKGARKMKAQLDKMLNSNARVREAFERDQAEAEAVREKLREAQARVAAVEGDQEAAREVVEEARQANKALEDEMLRQIGDDEVLKQKLLHLHSMYEQEDEAVAEQQIIEANQLARAQGREAMAVHQESLDILEQARSAFSLFADVEDVYEATRSRDGERSQLEQKASDSPEQYKEAMMFSEQIFAQVDRLKALGEPAKKYLKLLDPIPKALWPDRFVAESKDFAEIESLFVEEELGSPEQIREEGLRQMVANGLSHDAIGHAMTAINLLYCEADMMQMVGQLANGVPMGDVSFLSATDIAGGAVNPWAFFAITGVITSGCQVAADFLQETWALPDDPDKASELALRQLREGLEADGFWERVKNSGEDLSTLANCTDFMMANFGATSGMLVDGTGVMLPGVGMFFSAICVAYKVQAARGAFKKAKEDQDLSEEMEVEDAEDAALRGAMKNRASRSKRLRGEAYADVVVAGANLLATTANSIPGGTPVAVGAWAIEAGVAAIKTIVGAILNRGEKKKAEATLKKARQGSRRAMMDLFANHQKYATQLMLCRAADGNPRAVQFCLNRGLEKGELVDPKASMSLMRKFLLDADDQGEGPGKAQVMREWGALEKTRRVLDPDKDQALTAQPGEGWFRMQDKMISAAVKQANLWGAPYAQPLTSMEALKEKVGPTRASWEALQAEQRKALSWEPDADRKSALKAKLAVTTGSLGKLSTLTANLASIILVLKNDGPIPAVWAGNSEWAAGRVAA